VNACFSSLESARVIAPQSGMKNIIVVDDQAMAKEGFIANNELQEVLAQVFRGTA
jgi:hypothetical protein